MLTTEKQARICRKYRQRDERGLVHCGECPLRLGHNACRATYHYDRRLHEWVEDEDVKEEP